MPSLVGSEMCIRDRPTGTHGNYLQFPWDSAEIPTGTHVETLLIVRWATGKRLTNRLPKLNFTTISPPGTAGYSGPDRIHGSTCHPLVVPVRGTQGEYFSGSTWESSSFLKNHLCGGWWESNSRPRTHILPSSPCQNPCSAVVAMCQGISPLGYLYLIFNFVILRRMGKNKA